MGISIRDPEVGELARELANLRKTNMTEAIAHALRSELKRERDKRPLAERLAELAARARANGGSERRGKRDVIAVRGLTKAFGVGGAGKRIQEVLRAVDAVVCAAAEAMQVVPQNVRPALLAAFACARELGLTLEDVERVLRAKASSPA